MGTGRPAFPLGPPRIPRSASALHCFFLVSPSFAVCAFFKKGCASPFELNRFSISTSARYQYSLLISARTLVLRAVVTKYQGCTHMCTLANKRIKRTLPDPGFLAPQVTVACQASYLIPLSILSTSKLMWHAKNLFTCHLSCSCTKTNNVGLVHRRSVTDVHVAILEGWHQILHLLVIL